MEVGFLEDLDVVSGFEVVEALLPAGAAFLVTAIDSTRDVAGLVSLRTRLRDLGVPGGEALGRGVVLPRESLGALMGEDDFFTGFDELWVLDGTAPAPKPDAIVLTSERPIEPGPELEAWMRGGCLLGLGDGCGLNLATTEPALAAALRAAARSS